MLTLTHVSSHSNLWTCDSSWCFKCEF